MILEKMLSQKNYISRLIELLPASHITSQEGNFNWSIFEFSIQTGWSLKNLKGRKIQMVGTSMCVQNPSLNFHLLHGVLRFCSGFEFGKIKKSKKDLKIFLNLKV